MMNWLRLAGVRTVNDSPIFSHFELLHSVEGLLFYRIRPGSEKILQSDGKMIVNSEIQVLITHDPQGKLGFRFDQQRTVSREWYRQHQDFPGIRWMVSRYPKEMRCLYYQPESVYDPLETEKSKSKYVNPDGWYQDIY